MRDDRLMKRMVVRSLTSSIKKVQAALLTKGVKVSDIYDCFPSIEIPFWIKLILYMCKKKKKKIYIYIYKIAFFKSGLKLLLGTVVLLFYLMQNCFETFSARGIDGLFFF